MTVLLFQPSPTEKLLKRSKFSAVRWIRYRRRLETGGKSRTLDSCFCSRKRSSSSWTRWTKSFSAEERKTPSKQRRARVTDGRACRSGGQGRDQNMGPEAAHSPKCPCSKDFGDFRSPGHCGAGWEARECGAECAHVQSQAGFPAPSTASSRRVLPGLFSSGAQPTETVPQHAVVLPFRDPRRKHPTPSTDRKSVV